MMRVGLSGFSLFGVSSCPAPQKGGYVMRRRSGKFFTKAQALIALIALFTLLFACCAVGPAHAETERGSLEGRFEEPRVVEYNGQQYRVRNKDITTVLFMGVDTRTEGEGVGLGFRNGGQSDFMMLVVIDSKNERITPIHIDRDTITEITVLSIIGRPAGTTVTQICLSHAFGDGKAQSCEFAAKAVSHLLMDVDVDFYVAMNMDGIPILNDAVGGVTVTLTEDFSYADSTMVPGATLTLHGRQAEYYVRGRMQVGDGTNKSRMGRQRDYLEKLAKKIDSMTTKNANFIGELFDLLNPMLETDMARGRMINEVWKARNYTRAASISPAGEHTIGDDGFVEFHVNEDALTQMVLELFFEPIS